MKTASRFVPALALGVCLIISTEAIPKASVTADEAGSRPSVTVTRAVRREIVRSIVVSGTIVARDEVVVVSEVDGLAIVELLVEEGERVTQGQVLARLSRTMLDVLKSQNEAQIARAEAMIAQAKAQQAEAEANLLQARRAFERTQSLRAGGNATQEIYDQRVAAVGTAEARLNAAKHGLAVAVADLAFASAQARDIEVKRARTEIRAPAGGIISRRNARLGAIAATGASDPLFRLIADGSVELEADIAEVELPRLQVGQLVAVTPAGASVALEGRIRLISPEVDRLSRIGRVRVSLPGGSTAAIGSFARGVIETGRRMAVTLPLSAITYTRSGASVQSVRDGVVLTRPVRLGLVGDGHAEIVSGIEEGEGVIARAGTFVRDGDMITPVPPPGGALP